MLEVNASTRTLSVDIGGSGVKVMILDVNLLQVSLTAFLSVFRV